MTRVRLGRSRSLGLQLGASTLLFMLPALCAAQTAETTAVHLDTSASDDTPTPPLSTEPVLAESGFELGLGTGFAVPFGDADSGASLFDTGGQAPNSGLQVRDGTMGGIVSYRVPLLLDLGYRVSPAWYMGARAEAGTGGFGTECPTQANCNWTDARVGVLAKYHLDPRGKSDPWLGLNLGWEWMHSSASFLLPPEVTGLSSAQAVSAKQTISGPLLELLGGLGFDFGQHIHAGPFLSAAVGRYLRSSFDCPSAALGCPAPSWIEDGAFHAWLSLGISGSHGP
jgi:hypothetical protein